MATKSTEMKYSTNVIKMSKLLGISPQKVLKAVNNLLYGDGAVYRRVVDIPLHGCNS